jgi:N-acetylglucosamine-6-phosphate deacetylase
MATVSPRKAINLSSTNVTVGQQANLLRWHWDEAQQKLSWLRLK